jgi:thermitase
MGKKLKSTAMLILILTSLVSLSITLPISAARSYPVTSDSSKRAIYLNHPEDSSNVNEKRIDSLSSSFKSDSTQEKWNFSNTDEWSEFAYADGNKTRLVVGVGEKTAASLENLKNIVVKHDAEIVDTVSIKGKRLAVIVEILLASVSSFVGETRSAGLADYIEPNIKVQANLEPSDPYWNLQWGPKRIGADWAWNTTPGSSSLLVAVIDTGIDYSHPDLTANYAPLGYNWAYNNSDPLDDYGHGTHCAGIIAAVMNNNIGVAGVAQVKIMSEKILDNAGWGYADWFANGVIHATDCGAKILSISLAGYGESELMHDALKYAYDQGVLIVVAAGNENSNMKPCPAGYDEAIAVAATDQNDQRALFSNYGDWIELSAPGLQVYSTTPTYNVTLNNPRYGVPMNYAYLSGTSMACPHVAGVAALVWSLFPNKSRDWVRLWLRATADDLGDPGFDGYYGYGRVNARRAVEQTPPQHELEAYDLAAPQYIKPGTQGIINGTILNYGALDETDVDAQLWANDTMVFSHSISHLAAGDLTTVNFIWNPVNEGLYYITLYVVPVEGETDWGNNAISKYLSVGTPIKATVLHSAGNVIPNIIANWQELNSEWWLFGAIVVQIDYSSLNKDNITYADIAASEADVLIISAAHSRSSGWEFTDCETEAVERYVCEGHGLIVTSGTFSSDTTNNNRLGALLGINENNMWTSTYTESIEFVDPTHPVFYNVPGPLVFPRLGTTVPSGGTWTLDRLTDGRYLALGQHGESAIVEHAGLLYISTLLETLPPYNKHHLQVLYNAVVWTQYQKPQHDLITHLETPSRLQPDESVQINITVLNAGASDETGVELELFVNDDIIHSETIPELTSGSSYTTNYTWKPSLERTYNVTAYVPPALPEQSIANNKQSRIVLVRKIRQVLFDQIHQTELWYYYSQWIKSLTDRNFEVLRHRALNGPITSDALRNCDVFVIPQAREPFSYSEMSALLKYVQMGGSLLVFGDKRPEIYTNLTSFAGIYWQSGGIKGPTSDITPHSVTQRVNEVDLASPDAVITTSSPAQDLVRDSVHETVLAASENQEGKVVGFADEDTFKDGAIGNSDNLLLANNVIEWLAVKPTREHDLSVTLEAPRFSELGKSTTLSAGIANRGLENEMNVTLELLIDSTAVASESIPDLAPKQYHVLNFTWTPTTKAALNVTVYAPPVALENYTDNNARTADVSVFSYTMNKMSTRWVGGGTPMEWHADDGSWPYDLPFGFPFYGLSFTRIYVSCNGLITFEGPDKSWNSSLQELSKKMAIAPAWYDWKTSDFHDIYIQQNSTCVVIRWYTSAYSISADADFESILWIDGTIQFDYYSSRGPFSATVGISNGGGHIIAEDLDSMNMVDTRGFAPFNRDIATSEVHAVPTQIFSEQPLTVKVRAENRGERHENFPVQVFYRSLDPNPNEPTSTTSQSTVPEETHEGDSVWIEPSYTDLTNLGVGQKVNITLWVNVTVPSFAWQVQLRYNSDLLYATRCVYTEGTRSQFFSGHSTVSVAPSYQALNSTHSLVLFGETLRLSDQRAPGFGSLCWIEFMILTKPSSPFEESFELNPSQTTVLNPSLSDIPVTSFGAAYGVKTQLPPPTGPQDLIGEAIAQLEPGENTTLTFIWNTTGLRPGNYTIMAIATPLMGETNMSNNIAGGVFEIVGRHDVAVTNITASTERVYSGQDSTANVTVMNLGDTMENVTVLVYFNTTANEIIGQGLIQSLPQNESRTITITLDTRNVTACHKYTIIAVALISSADYNSSDNTLAGQTLEVGLLGDMNSDGHVDIRDISVMARAFGTTVGDSDWNPLADLNLDNKINIIDVALVAKNFGKTCR